MLHERTNCRLATIFAANVVRRSQVIGADEPDAVAARKRHNEIIIDPAVTNHRTHVVKPIGGAPVGSARAVDAAYGAVDDA